MQRIPSRLARRTRRGHPDQRLLRVLGMVGLLLLAGDAPQTANLSTGETPPGLYGRLPLMFEANHGQADSQVQFLARGSGYQVFLTRAEAVIAFRSPAADPRASAAVPVTMHKARSMGDVKQAAVRMTLEGANPDPHAVGLEQLSGKVNYLRGNDPDKWQTNVPTYAKVKYEAVYPGIDLVYYGNQRQLEYDFVVLPHADPTRIALYFEGADRLEVDAQGDLILYMRDGAIRVRKPVTYQEVKGVRKEIQGGYVLTDNNQVSFRVAAYDTSRPLVIDPILVYSTYLGGTNGGENGNGIAVDASGNAYVTGHTGAIDFPTVNPLQPELGGQTGETDVFVSKLNPSGSALVYSTYIGGSGVEDGNSIAVDASGSAYVTGVTGSIDFPTIDAFQPVFGGGEPSGGGLLDAFVAKLDSTGSAFVYASYLGGSSGSGTSGGAEVGHGIAVDFGGNAYVTGYTGSTDFPTVDAVQPMRAGRENVFVAKINESGSALVYSTYLGVGAGMDIAVDSVGNVYVVGGACTDFLAVNVLPPLFVGGGACVVKLNPAGSALVYATQVGGASMNGIALDAAGNAYVTGHTESTDFPTVNPLQPVLAGSGDAFIIKLNAAGSALVYSTYIGGTASDDSYGIAVDLAGNAYITGVSYSANFPTTPDALDTTYNGEGDAFVIKLNPTGSDFVYSTFLGGSSLDYSNAIAFDAAGNAYVIGQTGSTDFPTTPGAFQVTGGGVPPGNVTAFVAKVGGALAFAGKPGEPNCHGKSVSALAQQYGGLAAAAAALGFPDVQALQDAIRVYCED